MEDNKKEFIKEELYNNMKYIVYCLEVEIDIKSCSSREGYQEFLKGTEKHYGDCTKENCICQRCKLNEIEIMAQNSVDYIFFEKIEEPIPPKTEDINEADVGPEEEEIKDWRYSELEKVIIATGILVKKYPEEFKKIVEEMG